MSKAGVAQQKASLWGDTKFRWLIFSVAVVGIFEFLSLAGWHLPPAVDAPLFAVIILAIGYRTLLSGLRAFVKLNFRSINLLLLIATAGAFYLGEYEEAAVVNVLFTLGERLEQFGIQTSKSALQSLVDRTPKTATVKSPGWNNEVPISQVAVGDVLIIKPSEMIAMDAEVVSGSSSVEESTITGEPLPKDKQAGSKVFAGTLNMQGYLEGRVTKLAADSTLAKIIETTFAATKSKAETQKFIERFSTFYTPAIIVIALLLVIVPTLLFSNPFEPWFREALTLLVIACPCALVISTPISIYAAIGDASARGALVKGGKYIEAIGRVKAVAMDKTRTLTYGRPKVTDVLPFGESTREHLLACAAGIESYSSTRVGIREVRAEMLPEDKAAAVRELTAKYGGVAMVGDGVNDAPALALSSVGVAMGAAGSDTAIEAASIAILNDRLELIPFLIRLGRRAILTIKLNTALAIGTKLIFIALAIVGLSSLALAIFADVGVTVVVILNSLRLLRFEANTS